MLCGTVNPEQVFNILESKVLDENGNQTRNRRISPVEWNEFYRSNNSASANIAESPKHKSDNTFKKPNFLKQLKVFITRDVLSKISNTQYLAITLIEAPLLALILASLVKYQKNSHNYVFSENKNLLAYLFMCVLVALFVGLTVSAEEIFRDRKILKRESFLNLSKGSYLFSKIIILFFISAVQTLTFVLIGNYILEIKGLYLEYWLVLFTTSCFANMLGHNISASFNSAVTIYILVPFLLIPQILLSGVIVKFNELNPKISSQSVVPFAGEVMTSRWAFEALAVNQFINNRYEKPFFELDKRIYSTDINKLWCDKMETLAGSALKGYYSKAWKSKGDSDLVVINNEMKQSPEISFLDSTAYDALINDLDRRKSGYNKARNAADKKRENLIKTEQKRIDFNKNKSENWNQEFESYLTNTNTLEPWPIVEDEKIVAIKYPIYRDGSRDHFIRAHFFAPRKNMFGRYYDTFWVNILVIWTMSLLLWITLYFDALRKVLKLLEKIPEIFKRKK